MASIGRYSSSSFDLINLLLLKVIEGTDRGGRAKREDVVEWCNNVTYTASTQKNRVDSVVYQ